MWVWLVAYAAIASIVVLLLARDWRGSEGYWQVAILCRALCLPILCLVILKGAFEILSESARGIVDKNHRI